MCRVSTRSNSVAEQSSAKDLRPTAINTKYLNQELIQRSTVLRVHMPTYPLTLNILIAFPSLAISSSLFVPAEGRGRESAPSVPAVASVVAAVPPVVGDGSAIPRRKCSRSVAFATANASKPLALVLVASKLSRLRIHSTSFAFPTFIAMMRSVSFFTPSIPSGAYLGQRCDGMCHTSSIWNVVQVVNVIEVQ